MSKEEWEERIVKWWKEHKDVTKYVLSLHNISYGSNFRGDTWPHFAVFHVSLGW